MRIRGIPSPSFFNGLERTLKSWPVLLDGRVEVYMTNTERMLAAALRSHNAGRVRDAELFYRKILMRNQNHPGALNGLGVALLDRGRLEEARACLERLSRSMPELPEPYNNLGLVAAAQGRAEEALSLYRQAVALSPHYPDALLNLATALVKAGEPKESIPYFEQMLSLEPGNYKAHHHLAHALFLEKRLEESLQHYQTALALNPNDARVLDGMADALWAEGKTEECIACLRRAVEINPTLASTHSSLLFYLNYSPSISPEQVFEEHVRWGERHAEPLAVHMRPHANLPDPHRRLRVGYVSADFMRHVASVYFTPILAAHNRQQVEVFCYANVEHNDFITLRLKNRADAWREIWGMSDEQAAELIRADGIDILVDMNGHTAHHRLLTFARKPAPVQVTWLGYVNTTGMRAMDYRVTDVHMHPAGEADQLSTEELVRLPGPCYFPPPYCPAVGPLPARRNGCITFGSSNNPGKLSDSALETWAQVLTRIPDSRLQLNYPSFRHAATRAQISERFARHGIHPERIVILHTTHEENLASYKDVDISLDSFPYTGSTTNLESLWMGVPVVTLAGRPGAGRLGVAALTLVQLPDLVTHSTEQYVETAVALAGDWDRLERLRGELRNRMVYSPLTDVAGFTTALEAAYRRMWQRWCRQQPGMGESIFSAGAHFPSYEAVMADMRLDGRLSSAVPQQEAGEFQKTQGCE